MGVGKLDNNKNVQQLITSSDPVTMSIIFISDLLNPSNRFMYMYSRSSP